VSNRPTWRVQYDRMHRSLRQLQKAYEHVPSGDRGEAEDALYHFCCDAFHLRDWIQNSGVADEVKQDVRKLFRTQGNAEDDVSVALAACADLANGSEHLVLTQKSYSDGGYAEVDKCSVTLRLAPDVDWLAPAVPGTWPPPDSYRYCQRHANFDPLPPCEN
jgi:hypothetical protein